MSKQMRLTHSVDEIEQQLSSYFQPVQPNPDFIRNLHQRLTTDPGIEMEYPRPVRSPMLIMILLGVLSMILFVWLLRGRRSRQ